MQTTVQIVNPPTAEPLPLDLIRRHCRIDDESDDDLLAAYLRSARTMAEVYLSRVLITQTLLWTMVPQPALRPNWSGSVHGTIELPRAPVQSIESVTLLDILGNSTVITAATLPVMPPAPLLGYIADLMSSPARLTIGPSTVLTGGSTVRSTRLQYLQVEFVAGYADPTTIQQPILDAIMLTTAFLYEHRGDSGGDMPRAAEWLLDPYRMMFVG